MVYRGLVLDRPFARSASVLGPDFTFGHQCFVHWGGLLPLRFGLPARRFKLATDAQHSWDCWLSDCSARACTHWHSLCQTQSKVPRHGELRCGGNHFFRLDYDVQSRGSRVQRRLAKVGRLLVVHLASRNLCIASKRCLISQPTRRAGISFSLQNQLAWGFSYSQPAHYAARDGS